MKRYLKKYSTRTQTITVVVLSHVVGTFTAAWMIIFTDNAEIFVKIAGGFIYLFLLCLSTIFSIRRSKFGVEGITRIEKENDYSEIKERLKKAKHSIDIIVYHGNNLLKYTKDAIKDALERGVEVKILIAKEGSVMLDEVWELEGSIKNAARVEAWNILKEIKEETNEKTCLFKEHKYNTQARYSIIIIDGKWAWWTPYHPGLDVLNTSSFILRDNGKKSIMHECSKHFRILWNKLENDELGKKQKITEGANQ